MKQLDPLPPSSDEYFTKYEADTSQITIKENARCEHYFVRTSGMECECQKCHCGFYLTPDYQIKEGHLYQNEIIVI